MKCESISEKRAETFQKGVDQLLECPICLNQIKNPKVLPCQHSFCFDPCLKQMARKIAIAGNRQSALKYKYTMSCPICRRKSSVEDLNDFADNLTLKNLLEIRGDLENSGKPADKPETGVLETVKNSREGHPHKMEKLGFDLGGAAEGEGSKNGNPDRVSAIQRCIQVNNSHFSTL